MKLPICLTHQIESSPIVLLVQRYDGSADTSVRLQQADRLLTSPAQLHVLLSVRAARRSPHLVPYLSGRLRRHNCHAFHTKACRQTISLHLERDPASYNQRHYLSSSASSNIFGEPGGGRQCEYM